MDECLDLGFVDQRGLDAGGGETVAELTAKIAARIPLTDAAKAMQLAEARTRPGKVVLTP